MPVDDGISDDEFDGYLDADDDVGLDDGDAGADPTDADHGDFEQPLGCSKDMSGASPLQFFQQMVSDQMLDHIITLLSRQTSMPNNTWRALTFLRTPELIFGATLHSIGPS